MQLVMRISPNMQKTVQTPNGSVNCLQILLVIVNAHYHLAFYTEHARLFGHYRKCRKTPSYGPCNVGVVARQHGQLKAGFSF